MADENRKGSDAYSREDSVLSFWKENNIFEKSVEKEAPEGEFVFYDGPPFATGLPHYGSLLSSVSKDVFPRYKTMQGFKVRRRWGWDCHGLPIESLIEKRLNLKTKKDIYELGVEKFNKAARDSVLEFEKEWESYIERIGRWVDFKESYKTMDNTYIESVWWALKSVHEKGLLYEGRKVLMYCTHCETPLAKAEIQQDNSYKDITEEAVIAKFKVKEKENTYFLAWTTTPWTLPGNVGLAVNPEVTYVFVTSNGSSYIVAKERAEDVFKEKEYQVGGEVLGKELIGLSYEPLYEIEKVNSHAGKKHEVLPADFVTTEDGTGVVHTAVMYGEDDYQLGLTEGLPAVQLLDEGGRYNDNAPEFLRGQYVKKAESAIKDDLEKKGLLFSKDMHTHSYPHCYRCATPLIYNAVPSWFIAIEKVREQLLAENEEINWIPEHLKKGRFKNILDNAPDWTISRNRFWASPLPIWKEKGGDKVMVIGSLAELQEKVKTSWNRYFAIRHGEAESNVSGLLNTDPLKENPLTEFGKKQIDEAIEYLQKQGITKIYASPLQRTQETARRIATKIGIEEKDIMTDERIRETGVGIFEGRPAKDYSEAHPDSLAKFEWAPEGGENLIDMRVRMGNFIYDLEDKHQNETILIVSHGDPLWMLLAAIEGVSREEALAIGDTRYFSTGEVRELPFKPLPHNDEYELDFHRPYSDRIVLVDAEGSEYERIPEVVDCWVESGSMPFAEYHYPFENEDEFKKRSPADFISEYVPQTRTWFYYMHAMSVLLFGRQAFKNVLTTGTVLAADGTKMSKSKGNYTDPKENIEQYGADALRFYMMQSPVMHAEDLNFRDEELREAHNRVVNILWNSYKFFELYKDEFDVSVDLAASTHALDIWMEARLNEAGSLITKAYDEYDTPRVCKALRELIEDYSTWYVRRSRDRVRGEDERDRKYAVAMQRHALLQISKLAAPIMPFISESIFQGLGTDEESVHLSSWPSFSIADEEVLKNMSTVRELVSLALEQRSKHGIKVRQPLGVLKVKDESIGSNEALAQVLKDEVNVKEVAVDKSIETEVVLDPTITPELEKEGFVREFIRTAQSARKDAGLSPGDFVNLTVSATSDIQTVLTDYTKEIQRAARIASILFVSDEQEHTLKALGEEISLSVVKK